MPTPRRQTGSGGSLRRRRLLQWPAAALAVSPLERLVAQASTDGGDVRLALLIGNRVYPAPHDLPSIRKNVDDMAVALRLRGFDVSAHVDLDLPKSREAIDLFAQKCKSAPDDAIVFFYFSGHGSQFEAKNLLVAAGVNPTAEPKAIQDGSIVLGPDVLDRVPRPARGLTVAVVDACRTSLKALAPGEGLNQVEAPTGCLIAFSTGAGKPALAPAVENLNTFYTAALVKQLNDASDELTFSDLFRLAKLDTQRTMLNHPVALIRQFAQYPFIAENLQVPVLLARHTPPPQTLPAPGASAPPTPAAPSGRFSGEEEARDWADLQATLWPPDVVRLADAFMKRYPQSKLIGGALVAREGANEAAELLQRGEIRLFRRSFDPSAGDEVYRSDLLKAARGDKDAAARIGERLKTRATSGPELSRFEGWMQYAAELGNGIASYKLALHYRENAQPQPAARWEARARELGYNPPVALGSKR